MNNGKIKILDNFRENALLLAVFFLIRPERIRTSMDATDMIIYFVVFGLLLFETILPIIREKTLFCWEKAVFIATLCWEGCLIALRPFMELPSAIEWVSIVWMAALFIMMCIVAFLFPSLEKKGKWSIPISANDATGLAFNNYIVMIVSLLAINSSVF
mgnify:CR=1 FL=1